MSTRIGVISDTHGLLRPEVVERLRDCELILHGGDINRQQVLDALADIAPLYVVRGNNDKEWDEHIPYSLTLEVEGVSVFMVHNKRDFPADVARYDLVVYGHSHKYDERRENGTVFLNPGSCGPRRFTQPITMAVVTVNGSAVAVERIDIPHPETTG